MRAVIYCRVSTDSQETEGTSLQTQLEACTTYCQSKGYNIAYQFSEVCSGLTLDRPKLNELRELVRAHDIDVVVIYCLDRLSRDPVHGVIVTEELQKHNVSLEAVTETVESTDLGKLISYVRGYAAKLEAQKIRERTMRGARKRAEAGKIPIGGTGNLYGYYYVRGKVQGQGIRIENPDESKWLKQIFRWYVEDGIGVDRLAYKLRELGIPTPSGKGLWFASTVHKILTNTAYVGETYAFRETYGEPTYRLKNDGKKKNTGRIVRPRDQWIALPNATPPIIPIEVFQMAQEKLQRNKELARRNTQEQYLLRGFIRCARCNRAYWGYVKQYKLTSGKKRKLYYHCSGNLQMVSPIRCGNKNLNADKIETLVWAEVEKVISNPEIVISEVQRRRQEMENPNSLKQKLDQIDIQLKHLKKREQRVYRIYEFGGDEDLLIRDMTSIRTERQRLLDEKSQIESTLSKAHEIEEQRQGIEKFCELVKQKLSVFSIEEKRLALEALRIRVLVDGETVFISGSIPSTKGSVVSNTVT